MPLSKQEYRRWYDEVFPSSYPIERPPPVHGSRHSERIPVKIPGYGIGWVLTSEQVRRVYTLQNGEFNYSEMRDQVETNWRTLTKDPKNNKELLRPGPKFLPAMDHFIIYFFNNGNKKVMDSLISRKEEMFELYFKALGIDEAHKQEMHDSFKWYRTIVWEDL